MKKIVLIYLLLMSFIAQAIIKTDDITTNNPTKQFIDFLKSIDIKTTDGMYLPAGTTAQQPTPSKAGMVRFNTDLNLAEIYISGAWTPIGKGGISNWVTATVYKVGEVIIESDKIYQALLDHTSGTFATDLANGDWKEISAMPNLTGDVTSVGSVTTYNGIVPISKGGTGSATKNFVDLTTNQTIAGNKNFTNDLTVAGITSLATSLNGPLKATAGVVSSSAISLATDVSGILAVANGGTNKSTWTDGVAKIASNVFSSGLILNADIDPSAAIAYSKLASIPTGSILLGNAGTPTVAALSGGATVGATGVVTLGNSAVITQLLTGYTSGSGTVSASDSILSAIQKLNGNDALKQPMATLTTKGDVYAATGAGVVVRHGAGANGEIQVYDDSNAHGIVNRKQGFIDTESAIQYTGIEDISQWSTGNNATYFGAGTMSGTFVKDCSTPFSNRCSYTYTQASGSLNDWIASANFPILPKYRGDTVFLSISYSYDGNPNDIVPVVYNTAGPAVMTLSSVLEMTSTNGASKKSIYAVNFPSAQTSAQLGFHVKSLNNGKILKFNDIKLSKSIADLGVLTNLNYTEWARYTPAFSGFGTTTATEFWWRRVGDTLEVSGKTTAGTTGGILSLTLPNGLTVDPNKMSVTGYTIVGERASAANSTASSILTFGSSNSVYLGYPYATTPYASGGDNGSVLQVKFAVPIASWGATNSGVATAADQISSDTIPFTFKSTAIVDSDPVGTYNTYLKTANQYSSLTLNNVAPTQTSSSMNANGVQVFAVSYGNASTAAQPSRIDIKIGKNLQGLEKFGYGGTGKTNDVFLDTTFNGSSAFFGTPVKYNSTTGILSIDSGITSNATNTLKFFDTSGTYTNGFVVFNASKMPALVSIPDVTCKSAYDCTQTLTAEVAANGTVSNENIDWINGNCTNANPSVCTYNTYLKDGTNPLSNQMNCIMSPIGTSSNARSFSNYSSTSTSVSVLSWATQAGALVQDTPYKISCSKGTGDYIPKAVAWANPINSGIQTLTPVNTTSGTSFDFTIPSTAKRITVMFNGVSTSGSSIVQVQLATGGSVSTSSYVSGAGSRTGEVTSTTGLTWIVPQAANSFSGMMNLSLSNQSSNLWTSSGTSARDLDGFMSSNGGYKTLSGSIDRVRITTVNGTDTFDAGSINVSYEF